MSGCTQGHDPARAQTFLSRVRDGWRHLTLSLCCPLTSSHPAPWQPHHRSLGEPQEHFGRSGHRPRMPWGPTGPKLSLALTPSTRSAVDVPPAPASAAPGPIQPWLHFSQDDPVPTLYPVGIAALTAPGTRPKGRFHRGQNRPWGQPHHQSSCPPSSCLQKPGCFHLGGGEAGGPSPPQGP